jgi:hypothetical protein
MQGWGGGCIANSAIVRGGELEEGAHSGGKVARDVELGAFFLVSVLKWREGFYVPPTCGG